MDQSAAIRLRPWNGGDARSPRAASKRSIVIASPKTSVSLDEDAFWEALKEIARARRTTLSDLIAAIDSDRQHGNLSSAIRLFVLDFLSRPAVRRGRGGAQRSARDDGTGGARLARTPSSIPCFSSRAKSAARGETPARGPWLAYVGVGCLAKRQLLEP